MIYCSHEAQHGLKTNYDRLKNQPAQLADTEVNANEAIAAQNMIAITAQEIAA